MGGRYEELLHIAKSYIIDIIMGSAWNHSCMTQALVRCSIKADQGGTASAKVRVSLESWEGGKSSSIDYDVYGSTQLPGCNVHGPSAMATK